jgi:hypothetical protein
VGVKRIRVFWPVVVNWRACATLRPIYRFGVFSPGIRTCPPTSVTAWQKTPSHWSGPRSPPAETPGRATP